MNAIEKLRKVYNYLDNHAATGEADLIGEVIEELENPWMLITNKQKDGKVIMGWHELWKVPVAIFWDDMQKPFPWVTETKDNTWPEGAFQYFMQLPTPPTIAEKAKVQTNEESSAVQTESEGS